MLSSWSINNYFQIVISITEMLLILMWGLDLMYILEAKPKKTSHFKAAEKKSQKKFAQGQSRVNFSQRMPK